MLAMRAGMPCLVHGVGGLNDTVLHQVNGFSFQGANVQEKSVNLLATLELALRLYRDKPAAWKKIQKTAAASRFSWEDAVPQYLSGPYLLP
jgi:starch synthase